MRSTKIATVALRFALFALIVSQRFAACAVRAPTRTGVRALAVALAIAFAPPALAAAPSGTATGTYRVVIDAPSALREPLQKYLDLVRWQTYEELTPDLLMRLIREATEQARDIAAAEGYFSARVDITREPPPEGEDLPSTLRVSVEAGRPTRVTGARVRIVGPAADDVPAGTDAAARAQGDWRLRVGEVFRQADWDEAKKQAVATIAASPYAAARLAHSQARIDPDALTAELDVEIDSGPPFSFGALEIAGLERYPPELVRNFSTLSIGEPYSEAQLDQFVRRLNVSGYFASVQAAVTPDRDRAREAALRVSVIEDRPKRFEGGLGFSTDTRLRGNARYSDVNVDGRATQFTMDGRADAKIQEFSLRLVRPPSAEGFVDSAETKAQRRDIAGLTTTTVSAGVTRRTLEERSQAAYRAFYYQDEQRPEGAPALRSHALLLEYEHTWREVDNLIAPTRGFVLSGRGGGGPPGVSTRSFGRAVLQFAAWRPVGRVSTLDLRAEAGAVIAAARDGIPSALLFRTGGDTTVRGYAFESLGAKEGDAVVGGRYYAIASAEATRYVAPLWGIAAFVDAGNAGDDLRSLRPVLGYGAGLRVKSPIGPLRVDLAYGHETRQLRLHMSVGLAF